MAKAMPWADKAACRDSKLKWIVEPSKGRELAGSVTRCLDVCAECPVRVECLRFALEAEFSVMGVWGGTTMTERRLILPLDGFTTRHENQQVARRPREHARKVEDAIELFEATFAARRQGWRAFAAKEKEERAAKRAAAAQASAGGPPEHRTSLRSVLRGE
jgi:WhiB family redox-sensing transcriptional regulator